MEFPRERVNAGPWVFFFACKCKHIHAEKMALTTFRNERRANAQKSFSEMGFGSMFHF